MTEDIYHLAYISDARLTNPTETLEPGLLEYRLQDILETAQKNNEATEVTGALLYTGDHFAQILEGPQHAVNHWFSLISKDLRHTNVTPLLYESTTAREFSGWSMALCVPDDMADPPQIPGSKPDPNSIEADALGRSILHALTRALHKRETNTG